MKKYILAVLLALVGTAAFAQKGMQGFGVNLEASVNDYRTFGGGIKYQYHVANRDRIEASFSFRSEGEWNFAVSNHFFFNGVKRVRPYLITGLTVGGITFENYSSFDDYYYYDDYKKVTEVDFGFCGGLGLDCRLSHKWSCQIEAGGNKYILSNADCHYSYHNYIRHNNNSLAGFLRLGITYNF